MATVFDVAAYLIEQLSPLSTSKLQKLVYYSQAWSLVFDDRTLFDEPIEAWANGPAAPCLFEIHQGIYEIDQSFCLPGASSNLDSMATATIDEVLRAYGHLSADDLVTLTRSERPWLEARKGTPDFAASDTVIDTDTMSEYYAAVLASHQAN